MRAQCAERLRCCSSNLAVASLEHRIDDVREWIDDLEAQEAHRTHSFGCSCLHTVIGIVEDGCNVGGEWGCTHARGPQRSQCLEFALDRTIRMQAASYRGQISQILDLFATHFCSLQSLTGASPYHLFRMRKQLGQLAFGQTQDGRRRQLLLTRRTGICPWCSCSMFASSFLQPGLFECRLQTQRRCAEHVICEALFVSQHLACSSASVEPSSNPRALHGQPDVSGRNVDPRSAKSCNPSKHDWPTKQHEQDLGKGDCSRDQR
mmetsp:Transcript_128989/g.412354  ORF Transcript_128989/g.412354 Transcript_128989/m.412354 type:complete len:263 (-) Transcript_128989:292-1080(-)